MISKKATVCLLKLMNWFGGSNDNRGGGGGMGVVVCGLNIVNFIIVVRSCQNDSYETDGMLSLFHRIRLDPCLLFFL